MKKGGFPSFPSSPASSPGSSSAALAVGSELLPGELQVIIKRFAKKDPTTRAKALEELCVFVETADNDTAPHFVKLSGDVEQRIRRAAVTCHGLITAKVGRSLAHVLKEVIAAWLIAQYDPAKDVTSIASKSFDTAFPNRRAEVIAFCLPEIVQAVMHNVLTQTPDTMS
ncbi:hypothetical protein HK101_000212 [Irineochytrium annulatum]|nr:hypothetical protein HK101_000212 [Irineochytrium annulatum]